LSCSPMIFFLSLFQKTSVVCRWQTHTMRCITANMLQTKVTTIATVDVFELQRVICRKSPILTYPTCIWHLHWGVTPFELCPDIWQEKTTVRGLSCGIVCVILHLAVSVEHRLVIDGRTMMAYTALTWCHAVETFETKSQWIFTGWMMPFLPHNQHCATCMQASVAKRTDDVTTTRRSDRM